MTEGLQPATSLNLVPIDQNRSCFLRLRRGRCYPQEEKGTGQSGNFIPSQDVEKILGDEILVSLLVPSFPPQSGKCKHKDIESLDEAKNPTDTSKCSLPPKDPPISTMWGDCGLPLS